MTCCGCSRHVIDHALTYVKFKILGLQQNNQRKSDRTLFPGVKTKVKYMKLNGVLWELLISPSNLEVLIV